MTPGIRDPGGMPRKLTRVRTLKCELPTEADPGS